MHIPRGLCKSGITQGAVLGALLYFLFANDLSICTTYSHSNVFADDTSSEATHKHVEYFMG